MENLGKFFIDGTWVTPLSDRRFALMNPATETQFGEIALANVADVDRAVAAVAAAFEDFSRTSKAERLALLERLLSATTRRLEDLARAMSAEMGAPLTMAREA